MKKSVIFFILFLYLFSSCDKITNPVIKDENTINTDLYPGEGDYVIPPYGDFTGTSQNILIEDFTGHRCGNCPGAALLAHSLKDQYPGQVFVASIHSALPPYFFQSTTEPGDPQYPKFTHDFRTEAGDQYPLDISGFIGNPVGFINRTTDGSGQIWQFQNSWSTIVNDILDEDNPLLMNVQVNTNYYIETRGLFVHVLSETQQDITGRYNMVVYLIQDEYASWQLDYSATPQDVEFYHHKDVLLDNINGTYGTQLFESASVTGETFKNNYTYKVPDNIEVLGQQPNDNTGLSLIVYLMNRDTYEIVQVIEKKVLITF